MKKSVAVILLLAFIISIAGCAAGDVRFEAEKAGFWMGLWHGLICFVTFIISLFYDTVHIYEIRNSGHLYDLGFVIGIMIAFGGCGGSGICRSRKSPCKKEWFNVDARVEEKIRAGIRSGLDEAGKNDAEWEELGKKIEEKIKRELRDWAEK